MPLRWTDRHFTFDLPEALFPVVVERLRGTPARLEDKVRSLPASRLTRREGEATATLAMARRLLELLERGPATI
ncbi:MAG: hypothetical protein WAM82_07795 [Thermoanaerobaculia bacterium]